MDSTLNVNVKVGVDTDSEFRQEVFFFLCPTSQAVCSTVEDRSTLRQSVWSALIVFLCAS